MNTKIHTAVRAGASLICALLLVLVPPGAPLFAQAPAPPPPAQAQSPGPLLNANQLDDLVAPIALYPDPLLGQVLAASTYPLEVVEAQQWLQQNSNLQGDALINAARQQNWDPSVTALVAVPNVLTMLNRDIQWTTDLGNAFLAQQSDVMSAVQRMRVSAEQNGRLGSTPQQSVTTQSQNGQSAVVIEPTNPQVMYVPEYNPEYVWGPPVYGYYPPLWYPSVAYGFGYYSGIYMSAFFPGWGFGIGWPGWGFGWGWGLGWFGGGLFTNAFFFNHYGFPGFYHGGAVGGAGRFAWAHDAFHRGGVPYANGAVAARYNNARFAEGRTNMRASNGARGFGGAGSAARSMGGERGFGGAGSAARGMGGERGFGGAGSAARSMGGARGFGGAGSAARGFGGAGSAARGMGGERGFGGAGSAARGFAPSDRGAMGNSSRGFSGTSSRGSSASGFAARSSAPSFQGSSRGYAERSFGGGSRAFSGGGSSARSFGGGGARSFGGGGGGGARSFGGGGGGGHAFGGGGGGGHSGGGGGRR